MKSDIHNSIFIIQIFVLNQHLSKKNPDDNADFTDFLLRYYGKRLP